MKINLINKNCEIYSDLIFTQIFLKNAPLKTGHLFFFNNVLGERNLYFKSRNGSSHTIEDLKKIIKIMEKYDKK